MTKMKWPTKNTGCNPHCISFTRPYHFSFRAYNSKTRDSRMFKSGVQILMTTMYLAISFRSQKFCIKIMRLTKQ